MRSDDIKAADHGAAPGSKRPGLWLRLRTWFKGMDLDAQLAEGVDPTQSPELTLRAQQLASPRMRAELAFRVSRAVELADRGFEPGTITTRIPIRRTRVRACRQWLLQIVQRLRDDRPRAVRGLAMTALLLEDGSGPLYADGPPAEFEKTVRTTLVELDTAEPFQRKLRSFDEALQSLGAALDEAVADRPAVPQARETENGRAASRTPDRRKIKTPTEAPVAETPAGRR
jgi:hypothetical protein